LHHREKPNTEAMLWLYTLADDSLKMFA